MLYHQEVLDRSTGDIESVEVGDWITVTELGKRHGVGPKTTRAILHHMGVLAVERTRYRLLWSYVEAGIGKRHDKPKSGFPFDVISPKGQALIDSAWSTTAADYAEDGLQQREVTPMRQALAAFKSERRGPMATEEEVCWLLDHFPGRPNRSIAEALEVSPALVIRYDKRQRRSREDARRRKDEKLGDGRMFNPVFSRMTPAGPMPFEQA